MTNLEKQIQLLKKYNVTNYSVINDKITINGWLDLRSLTQVDKDFLKDTTINGWLDLRSLTQVDKDFLKDTTINGGLDLRSLTQVDKDFLKNTTINGGLDLRSLTQVDKDFLKNTTINGDLDLRSLTQVDKDFLKNTTINGGLDLRSLTQADKDFLKGTTINGWLDLRSLTQADKDFLKGTTINGGLDLNSLTQVDKDILRGNVKQLTEGYNKERGYCYFDGILSKVLKVETKKDYTIYTTPFGFVVQKGDYTAHGTSVKKCIQDLEFKVIAEKLKKDPIEKDTLFTVKYYRLLTGACEQGCKDWMQRHNIPFQIVDNELVEVAPMKAVDLLPILEESNAYGLARFKELITW